MKPDYPKVLINLGNETEKNTSFYLNAVGKIFSHAFPPDFFEGDGLLQRFHKQLPLVSWTPLAEPPFNLTFFLCCMYREGAFRFFEEMISLWLLPGKKLNTLLQFAANFSIPEFGPQKYIGGQIIVRVENSRDLEILSKNLPHIESEIRLGVGSPYHANRILETKGMGADKKTTAILENLVSLIHKRPQDFDYDILSEMQQFMVLCKEEFKKGRTIRQMSRIICIHYLFRKAFKLSAEVYPDKRYISIKLLRAAIPSRKKVLGLAIGLSFIRDNEHFEAKHVMSGITSLIPDAKFVEGSFFLNRDSSSAVSTIYLEIEKGEGRRISFQEEKLLKLALPQELKTKIAVSMNPIFMPQNEEEIMRHILTLSHQLKYVRDLPQVIIGFNQQTEDSLEFIVILLRVLLPDAPSFSQLFKSKNKEAEYNHDRTKIVGSIRKKYPKEASVFYLRVQKAPFLRKDHSIDLNKARKEVVKELSSKIGEFRDYNGGIIAKETEIFETLRTNLDLEKSFLLENFFYALTPPVMRSLLSETVLKRLFLMVLEGESDGIEEDQLYSVVIQEDEQYTYFLLLANDPSFYEILSSLIENFEGCITQFFLPNTKHPCFGAIVDKERSNAFKFLIEKGMTESLENQFLLQR